MSHEHVRVDALTRMLGQAFDAAFDEALADLSTTRAEFVMLGRLTAAPAPLAWSALESAIGPAYGPVECTAAWNALEVSGWAVHEDGLCTATEDGRALVQDLHDAIDDIADRATAGLTDDENDATVATLRRMLGNLGG